MKLLPATFAINLSSYREFPFGLLALCSHLWWGNDYTYGWVDGRDYHER